MAMMVEIKFLTTDGIATVGLTRANETIPASTYTIPLWLVAKILNSALEMDAEAPSGPPMLIGQDTWMAITHEHITLVKRFPAVARAIRLSESTPSVDIMLPDRWWKVQYQTGTRNRIKEHLYVEHVNRTLSCWPYGNVYDSDSHVCWGHNPVPAQATPDSLDELFFSTPFNPDLRLRNWPASRNCAAEMASLNEGVVFDHIWTHPIGRIR